MAKFLHMILDLFDPVYNQTNKTTDTTATTGNDLSVEMKTYYSDYLIDMAEPELVHDQWAQKRPIPKNGGKTIEFRKFAPLPKALTPLSEGVTPLGQKLSVSNLTATVQQYGGFIELSDVLMLTAIDNNLVEATKLLGSQAGRTSDTITRDILHTGTNVLYANNKAARSALVQGTDKLTVRDIRKATRKLKLLNTPMIGGYYIGIIHPDLAFDLMDDNDWKYPHQYVDTKNIYMGELGAIAGVRFSETTEAKVIKAEELPGATGGAYTVASYSSNVITISDELTSANATALVGKTINVGTEAYTVTAATAYVAGSPATAATITIKETPGTDPATNDKVYAGNAGKGGANVYGTLILGDHAYGVTDITGGGLQHIVKQLGSSGTADPLNQRATVGWKLMKTAAILVQEYMVRIESTSSFATTESN